MMRTPDEILAEIPVADRAEDGSWTNKLELIPGRTKTAFGLKPRSGMTVHRLPNSGFVVAEVHYSVDKRRREPGWALASSARYGRRGVKSYKWRQEMEIDFDASSGDPVYANWEPDVHVIDGFPIPPEWPKWIMFDPGGVNPHALEWWAMDPTPPLYTLYAYRQWYNGMKMPDKSEGTYYLAAEVIRIAHELSIDHLGHMERLDALIIDPASRQTRAVAGKADGESPTPRAESMYEEILDVCDQLGWRLTVVTGNNLKDASIDEVIDRLGNYPLYLEENGEPVMDAEGLPVPQRDEAGNPIWVPPRLYVFRSCRWLSWEFSHYQWADWSSDAIADRTNSPEAPMDKNDHSMTNLIRLMNWIRRDPKIYERRKKPSHTNPTAELLAKWRERRKEALHA